MFRSKAEALTDGLLDVAVTRQAGCHDDIYGWASFSALATNSILLRGISSHPAIILLSSKRTMCLNNSSIKTIAGSGGLNLGPYHDIWRYRMLRGSGLKEIMTDLV